MKRLEGKVAVITGGNSGIGLATAKRFLDEGAKVAISGRNQKTLEEAVKSLGDGVLAVKSDTAKLEEIEKFLGAVSKKFGKIDVLFVNAGVAKFAPLTETGEALFDEQFDINIKGAYFTVQKALPFLNDGASVIFNTSVAGSSGVASTSAYSATKAALRSLGRTLAVELLPRGIRVNVVSPGPISTPIFEKSNVPVEARPAMAEQFREAVPMKRFGLPEEVARAAAFLAFEATFTTGADLPVDGGIGQV